MFIRIRPPKWSMALLLLGGAVGVVAQDASDSLTRWYRWDDLQIQSMVYEREAALWPQVLGLGNSMHASVKPFFLRTSRDSTLLQTGPYGHWNLPYGRKQRPLWAWNGSPNAEKRLRVEPLIELGAGAENFGGPGLNLEGTMENVRGVQIAGQWTQAFHFQSSLALHNYPGLPDFIEDQIRDAGPVEVMPGLGFTRKLANNAQWDLYTAQALIRWEPKPWLNIQAGQGKNFIGHGYRSMLLSDCSPSYPHLRLQAQWGPWQYQYYVSQMLDYGSPRVSGPVSGPQYNPGFAQKYAAMGYLDWNLNRRLQLGLFQAVLWPGRDSLGSRGMNWSFAQPLLFWIPSQNHSGSYGNALIGLNLGYKVGSQAQLYGQLILDELYMGDFFRLSRAWTNKYAYQLGIRGWDPWGWKGVRWLIETNHARPFMYSHWSTATNYGHQQSALAHPLGANFREILAHFQIFRGRWHAGWQTTYALQGRSDSLHVNLGNNINLNYWLGVDRNADYPLGTGVLVPLFQSEITASYVLYPPTLLRLECSALYRDRRVDRNMTGNVPDPWGLPGYGYQSLWFRLGLRTLIENRYRDY